MRLLFITLLSVFIAAVKSAVIGIDLGTNYYKISLIAPGKTFVIVESMASKRKVETAISLVSNKRFFESDSLNKRVRYPTNTFSFLNKFLGAVETDQEVFEVSKQAYDEYLLSFNEERGTAQFQIKNWIFDDHDEEEDAKIILTVEEVFGMIFSYAKKLSEKMASLTIKDCVVSLPSHWGPNQRIALSNALQISGLNPLTFISDNAAAGLYYGLERMDVNQTHTILFYNLGATNLQTSIIEFSAVNKTKSSLSSSSSNSTKNSVESVRVISDYVVENVGGIEFDKILANYFVEIIDEKRKGKPSIKENKRVMRRIIKEMTRVKEILSSNKQAQYYSEGLFDGNDFSATITRQEFEERSKHVLEQLTMAIDKVLDRAGMSLKDIDIIELLGGGTRVPVVQQVLQQKVGELELGTHLNGDESTALGASYQGANFSHSFRIRDVLFTDGYNFEVKAEITNLEEVEKDSEQFYHKNFTLFPIKKRFGTKKSVNFANKNNMKVNLYTVDYDGNESKYATFNLTNIDKIEKDTHYNETTKPKVHLEFEISSIEGILLQEAQVKFNYTGKEKVTEKELKKIEKEKEKARKKAERERKKKEKENNDTEKADEEKQQEEEIKYELDNDIVNQTIRDGETTKQILFRYKNKTRNLDVKIDETYYGIQPLSKSELRRSKRVIRRFELFEERQRNLSDIKNKFESYIYKVRDFLEDEYYIKYSKEEELKNLTQLKEYNQEWLDSDEAFHGNFSVFDNKLKEMETVSFPTLIRLEEARLRPDYVNKTISAIETFKAKTAQLEKENKWLNETDLKPLKDILQNVTDWLKGNLNEQKDRPLNEDPVFSIQECKPRVDEINRIFHQVKAIKEPKKAEEKKSKKKAPKKTKIKLGDGEEVEIDLEELRKKQEFKNFDFEKFEENMRKEQEKKEREEKEKQDKDNSEDVEQQEQQNEQQEEQQQQEQQGDSSEEKQQKDDL